MKLTLIVTRTGDRKIMVMLLCSRNGLFMISRMSNCPTFCFVSDACGRRKKMKLFDNWSTDLVPRVGLS
jgi:hypothetical protein